MHQLLQSIYFIVICSAGMLLSAHMSKTCKIMRDNIV